MSAPDAGRLAAKLADLHHETDVSARIGGAYRKLTTVAELRALVGATPAPEPRPDAPGPDERDQQIQMLMGTNELALRNQERLESELAKLRAAPPADGALERLKREYECWREQAGDAYELGHDRGGDCMCDQCQQLNGLAQLVGELDDFMRALAAPRETE